MSKKYHKLLKRIKIKRVSKGISVMKKYKATQYGPKWTKNGQEFTKKVPIRPNQG